MLPVPIGASCSPVSRTLFVSAIDVRGLTTPGHTFRLGCRSRMHAYVLRKFDAAHIGNDYRQRRYAANTSMPAPGDVLRVINLL